MRGGRKIPAWTVCTILAAVSCGVYLNTLQAGFTFDDFFAVVRTIDTLLALHVCEIYMISLGSAIFQWTSCCAIWHWRHA